MNFVGSLARSIFPPISAFLLILITTMSLAQKKRKTYYPSVPITPVTEITKIENQQHQGVVLIIIDALRPDHLHCLGYKRNTSPMMDRLAKEGVIYSEAFANAPWTRPSTACIFTSLNTSRHGVETETSLLSDDFLTLAEVLSQSGIKTGAVIGNGNVNSLWGFAQGFDDYMDTREYWKGLPNAKQVFALGKKWVRTNKDNKFFLTLFVIDPHSPYESPPYYEKMFTKMDRKKILRQPKWQYKTNLKPVTVANMVGLYDGAIRYVDDVIRGFVKELKTLGIYDKTTIMITSDHGEGFGEHNRYRHAYHFYEEFIRIPLIIKSPRIKEKNVLSDQLVESLDFYPTIVDLFDLEIPSHCDGISLFANTSGGAQGERVIFSEYNNFGLHNQCIRNKKWKLIFEDKYDKTEFYKFIKHRSWLPLFRLEKERYLLYNLKNDPFERKNLYYKKPEMSQTMLGQLKKFLHEKPVLKKSEIDRSEIDPKILKNLKSIGYFQ